MATTWGEMFPPRPTFTEEDMADQHGRVFIVTGGSSGVGFEVAKAIFHLNGRVYIAARSSASAERAIADIRASSPPSNQAVRGGKGELIFLRLDLGDLSTIKASASEFLAKEARLDVIWHNAGVMIPEDEAPTKQGYNVQLGVNALGPFLFQKFLTPLCLRTAALQGVSKSATRIIFVSSSGHRASPKPDGVEWDDLNLQKSSGMRGHVLKYGQSKAMNVMHAYEIAHQFSAQGLVSFSLHPGALSTNLQSNAPRLFNAVFSLLRHPPRFGALTELFAGLAPLDDGTERMLGAGGVNGGYVLPWGRFGEGSPYVFEGLMKRGTGQRLWKVCKEMLQEYM